MAKTPELEKGMEFANIVPVILEKLNKEKTQRPLTNFDIMEVIVDTYLRNENFVKVDDGYQLSVNDTIYKFKLKYPDEETVLFRRYRYQDSEANRWSRLVGHPFYYKLTYFTSGDEKVEKKLRKELRRMNAALSPAWKYLHMDESPSESEFPDEFEFIDQDSD